jgi:hypothetical protein
MDFATEYIKGEKCPVHITALLHSLTNRKKSSGIIAIKDLVATQFSLVSV